MPSENGGGTRHANLYSTTITQEKQKTRSAFRRSTSEITSFDVHSSEWTRQRDLYHIQLGLAVAP